MKFTPTPKPNNSELKEDISAFGRKLRLLEYFADDEGNITHETSEDIVRNKSNFVPPRGRDAALDQFIEQVQSFPVKSRGANQTKCNLSKSEWKALKRLQNDTHLVIKEADKGGCVVVMDDHYYESKIMEQLQDEDTYVQVEKNIDDVIMHLRYSQGLYQYITFPSLGKVMY